MRKLITYFLYPFKRQDDAFCETGTEPVDHYMSHVKKQFRKNRLAVFSLRFVYAMIFIALFADFISNDKPLAAGYKGKTYFPVLRSYLVAAGISNWPAELRNVDWKQIEYDWSIFTPVPYLPKNLDEKNSHSVGPFETQQVPSTRWRHWLGTDELGRDVLAAMIHGTRIALSVGLVSMGIASFIGIILGALAGYYGDQKLKMSRIGIAMNVILLFLGFFYAFSARAFVLQDALAESFWTFLKEIIISLLILVLFLFIPRFLAIPFKKIAWLGKEINLPVDIMISRLIEIMNSIPTLFLIISISAIVTKPSIFIIMVIIGCTSWTGIARFIRGELLRIRSLDYIEASKALGLPEKRILLKHAIPNALSPVLITIAFGIAGAILVESTLSFLGIGVPPETLTWGSLLATARQSSSAWWLALFPGCAIFITVTVYNLLGEGLTDAMDPRLRK